MASLEARDGMPPGDWLAAVAFPTMLFSVVLPWMTKTGAVSTAVPVYGYDTSAVFLAPIAIAGYVALWSVPGRGARGRTFMLLGAATALLAFSLAFEPDAAQSCGFFKCERGSGVFVAFASGLAVLFAGTMLRAPGVKNGATVDLPQDQR
ncbi:MAG: hypothetical protein HY556_05440 [Euryarchaeota archaeon]|nr:hypothetical protein [Euryarchaeota archaeon]